MSGTRKSRASDERKQPSGPLSGLAFIGSVDAPATDAARMIWLGDAREIHIGRGDRFLAQDVDGALQISVPDERVSTDHALILRGDGGYTIEDRGSSNGSLVNGQPLLEARLLRPGDVLETGHSFWRFVSFTPGQHKIPLGEVAAAIGPTRTISPALVEQVRRLESVVKGKLPIVLLGETGVGKEVMAHHVHRKSGRPGEFRAVNCAAVPAALLESELFGHSKGAFTGAVRDHVGLVEAADKGTFFLDEVGDLPQEAQVKLLRVLQDGKVQRVGESRDRNIDVRLVTATHRDLPGQVRGRRFRADLYGRLAGFTVRLPPLRDRVEDLGILIAHLLRRFAGDAAAGLRIDPPLMRRLLLHPWPFNVRELERIVESAVLLAGDADLLELSHVEAALAEMKLASPHSPSARTPEDERRELIESLLAQSAGNVSAVARAMNKSRAQVHRWMKQYAIRAARPE